MSIGRIAPAFLLVVAVSGVLLYRDATAAQRHLRAAEESLRVAERQVGEEQFDLAAGRLQEAADDAEAALERLDGPLWALVSTLPRVGDVPELGRAAADLGLVGQVAQRRDVHGPVLQQAAQRAGLEDLGRQRQPLVPDRGGPTHRTSTGTSGRCWATWTCGGRTSPPRPLPRVG